MSDAEIIRRKHLLDIALRDDVAHRRPPITRQEGAETTPNPDDRRSMRDIV